MEQSKTENHRAGHKTRASPISDKGLDAANHNRASGGGRKMFLTSPLIEQAIGILTLEPERLQNRLATTREDHRRWKGLFTRDAQAACDFSFSASKFSPFFHKVSVIAAILRASVRRAMVGLMPLASDRW